MMVTAERVAAAAGPTGPENLCPSCGPVAGPRSFYCQVHIAALWRQIWDYRPESGPRAGTTPGR
jgi:hypothetical protein